MGLKHTEGPVWPEVCFRGVCEVGVKHTNGPVHGFLCFNHYKQFTPPGVTGRVKRIHMTNKSIKGRHKQAQLSEAYSLHWKEHTYNSIQRYRHGISGN